MALIDERAVSRAEERRLRTVARPRLEEYREKYAEHFTMERHDGILEVRMHSNGKPVVFNLKLHSDFPQLWIDIGNDPDNEVLIISGTGDKWMDGADWASFGTVSMQEMSSDAFYDLQYSDSTKHIENLLFNIDIPTIACVNGPGLHTEFALLCDLTLCSEDAEFFDSHFGDTSVVPGDGLGAVFQELLGPKRAAYYLYTSDRIDAETARELGLVNEVLARDDLLPRARAIAEKIMRKPRATRRFTASIVRRPWKRLMLADLGHHMAHEFLAMRLDPIGERR